MIQFNEDFHITHATLSADRRLFNTLFGITRQDYCSLFPDDYPYNDELCWELLEEVDSGWIATIPSAEEIAAKSSRKFNDCQPRYPWRHIDECPIEVEPYPLCLKLLKMAGSEVLVTTDALPYCGGLDRYGGFVPSMPIELLPNDEPADCVDFCRSIETKTSGSRLAVGYALTEGVWRPHCWLIRDDGTLLEPTEPRELYYGVLLNKKAGARFVRQYATAEQERRYLPEWK